MTTTGIATENGQDAPEGDDSAETHQDTSEGANDPQEAAQGADDTSGEVAKLRKEAARHRTAARDAEAERDTLRQRVETLQRREVERMVAGRLAVPNDIWRFGVELPELLDDDSDVSEDKVREAVDALAAERPNLTARKRVDLGQGNRSSLSTQPSWHEVLRSR